MTKATKGLIHFYGYLSVILAGILFFAGMIAKSDAVMGAACVFILIASFVGAIVVIFTGYSNQA